MLAFIEARVKGVIMRKIQDWDTRAVIQQHPPEI